MCSSFMVSVCVDEEDLSFFFLNNCKYSYNASNFLLNDCKCSDTVSNFLLNVCKYSDTVSNFLLNESHLKSHFVSKLSKGVFINLRSISLSKGFLIKKGMQNLSAIQIIRTIKHIRKRSSLASD